MTIRQQLIAAAAAQLRSAPIADMLRAHQAIEEVVWRSDAWHAYYRAISDAALTRLIYAVMRQAKRHPGQEAQS